MHPARNTYDDPPPSSEDAAPTVAPPPPASVIRYKSGAPVDELLYRIAMGDVEAAIDAAQELIDAGYVPVQVSLPFVPADLTIGYGELQLLSLIDGCAPLGKVLDSSGLEMVDALRALCELIEKDVVTVC